MTDPLDNVIAACTQWLLSAFPASGGAHAEALARAQARQAVTVAAWLRYPTTTDAALLGILAPSGSWWLDSMPSDDEAEPWRTWVDDVVVSWAATLLADRRLAVRACGIAALSEHAGGLPFAFGRLTDPDDLDLAAAALLRHPDFLAALGERHRETLHLALRPAA